MALRRKVFVGSLFEFSKIGQEDFLQQLRQQSEAPDQIPVIFYNENLSLFSGEVNTGDDDIVSRIISKLDQYVKHQGKNSNNLVDTPKVVPMTGTTINDEVEQSEPILPDRNQLVQIEDSSDEEVQAPGDTYWKPQCGEISILSADVAQEIANLTGCRVFFENPLQRVKLVTGNIPLAMEKLKAIEGVLTLCASYKPKPNSPLNKAARLIRYNPKATIRSVRMASDVLFGHPRRVIVDFASPQSVLRARLAEIRIEQQGSYQRPVNLDQTNLSLTAECFRSQNFRQVLRSGFGDPSRAEPRSAAHKSSNTEEFANHLQIPNKFLPEKDAKRVSEWREQVDQQATPDALPADPVPESKPSVGRRRVAVESSSDEEDEAEPQSQPQIQQTWDADSTWKPEVSPLYVASRHIDWAETPTVATAPQTSGRVDQDIGSTIAERAPDLNLPNDPSPDEPEHQPLQVSPARTQSKNVFDVLSNENGDHDADTEVSMNDKSSSSIKQLNVTFEEPEPSSPAPSMKGKLPVTRRPVSPRPPQTYASNDVGKKQVKIVNSGLSHRQPSHRRNGSENGSPRGINVPTGPRSHATAMASPNRTHNFYHSSKPESYSRGNVQRPSRRNAGLIDVSSNSPPESPVLPPPGFEFRLPPANGISDDLVSYSNDVVTRPAFLPDSSNEPVNNTSSSRSETSSIGLNQQDFNPQLTVPKRNINYLREEAKAKLEAMSKTKSRRSTKDSETGSVPRERIQKGDEYGSRKYHRTMSQKAPKPGNKGKKSQGNQNESKADKQARIAKAMMEAYGNTNSAKPAASHPVSRGAVQPEPMSSKKRQMLKKNDIMADMHKDILAKNADDDATREVVAMLHPILKATRAFKGSVTLEMQFGQAIMIDHTDRVDDQRLYNPEDWLKMLNSGSSDIETLFTNKLTTNGLEIDRLLSMKAGQPPTKLWHSKQDSAAVDLEFRCYDKTGFEFSIILDQRGNHILRKPTAVIGKVPLYCPAQVWDMCVVIFGRQAPLCPSTELVQGVEEFIDNLYISTTEEGGEVSVFHRLPKNGAFTVQAIYVKSTTTHECTVPDRSQVQLRLTEIKDLLHRNHATDKALFNSYEDDYDTMTSTRRLHYEVAIIHKEIEASFKDNLDIEIGTLTPDELSVSFAQMRDLVTVSADMLEGMDWVGAKNYGTLQRMHDAKAEQHATVTASLPPNVATTVPIPMGTTAPPTTVPSVYHNQQSRLGAGTATNANTAGPEPMTRIIRGVRANTSAELYQEGGQYFYYGQGGARIPVVDQQLEGLVFDARGPVVPDDSASQIGNTANARQRIVLAQRKKTEQAEKPAGFW